MEIQVQGVDPEHTQKIKELSTALQGYGGPNATRDRLEARLETDLFKVTAPYVQRSLRILEMLRKCEMEQIPTDQFQNLIKIVNTTNDHLNRLSNHKLGEGQTDYLQLMKADWIALYNNALPHIVWTSNLMSNSQLEANQIIESLQKELTDAKNTSEQLVKILEDAKKAAGELGITEQAKHFKELANRYENDSRTWLKVLACAILAGLLYAFLYLPYQFNHLPADLTPAKITQLILNKVLIVSLLFFGIGWLARNYTASRHNFVTNQHRQTALSTFETIVNGVQDDPQARNAVLVYASQAIFMPTPTGYGKGDIEVQQINPIVDLVSSARKLTP